MQKNNKPQASFAYEEMDYKRWVRAGMMLRIQSV